MLDEDDYEPIGFEARREAELAMKKRDRGVSSYDKPSGSHGARATQPSIPFSRMPVALTQDEEGEHFSLQPPSHLCSLSSLSLSLSAHGTSSPTTKACTILSLLSLSHTLTHPHTQRVVCESVN